MHYILLYTIIALCLIIIIFILGKRKRKIMSFKKSLDIAGFPIITMSQGDKKFGFILDSGASLSAINGQVLEQMEYRETDIEGTAFGITGERSKVKHVEIDLQYGDTTYTHTFQVINLSQAMNNLQEATGIRISGLIGSDFLAKYKYIMDFEKLGIYIR